MKTCKICRYSKMNIFSFSQGGGIYYTCKLLNKDIRYPKIRGMFCKWFFLNDRCLQALEERRELSAIQRKRR